MAQSYFHKVLIDSRDVDGQGICKASALLGHLQEAATQAAEQGGFGRSGLLKEYQAFWMLTRVWYHLKRPLYWGEEVTIHTWHRGGRSAVTYRDYDILVDGQTVGEGVAAWVLADLHTHKLLRLSEIGIMETTSGGELCKTKKLAKVKAPARMDGLEQRIMRYSDTDINGHVNNTRYADFACDALRMDQMPKNYFLAEIQIGYLAECRPGEVLNIRGMSEQDGSYICGVDENGTMRFESALRFEEYEEENQRLCLK